MVTGVSRLDDAAFLFSAWSGLKAVREQLECNTTILESRGEDDVEKNLRYLAYSQYDHIWSIGFNTAEAVAAIAPKFLDTTFCTIDIHLTEPQRNVITTEFAEQEGAFLAGWIAAALTKTATVGFLGGVQSPLIRRFQSGFVQGVRYRNPNVTVQVEYANSFVSYNAGHETADHLYQLGCDILFHAAGSAGRGAIRSAVEHKRYIIGVDTDQSFLAPTAVITSMLKRVDRVVYDLTTTLVHGEDVGERRRVFGIADKAILLAPVTHPEWTTDLQQELESVTAAIQAGTTAIDLSEIA